MALPPEVEEGARRFDAGDFFGAHEAWEEHWGSGPQSERDLVKGLIKVAVAFHHLTHGNPGGFEAQVRMALPLLRANVGVWPELDVATFADEVDSVAAQARFHGKAPAELPRLGPR